MLSSPRPLTYSNALRNLSFPPPPDLARVQLRLTARIRRFANRVAVIRSQDISRRWRVGTYCNLYYRYIYIYIYIIGVHMYIL